MIIPRVKEYKKFENVFSGEIVYDSCHADACRGVRLIGYFAPAIVCKEGENETLVFKKEQFPKKGSYRLSITEDSITITYGDEEGLRNAIASLVQLKTDYGFSCVEIYDEPDNEFRGTMYDFARGYLEVPRLKEYLVRTALMKYNYAHFHLMDHQSCALELDTIPTPAGQKVYSKEEMKEIVALCRDLGLTVIPELEVPGHAGSLVRARPELACDLIDEEVAKEITRKVDRPDKVVNYIDERGISNWVVCAGKDSTYEIYRSIIKEFCEIFDGPYIHIGGDEIRMRNVGAVPHWDNCYACKALMAKEGITDFRGMVYYVFRRVNEIVKSFGKQAIIWNDQLEVGKPIDLPKDIIVDYWYNHMIVGDDGTLEPGVYQLLLDQGFTTINSMGRNGYTTPNCMKEADIRVWDTHDEIVGDEKVSGSILGGKTCSWETGNPMYSYYHFVLPIANTVFADRLWNNQPTEYNDAYKSTVFAGAIGRFGKTSHPLNFFPEIIPPRVLDKSEQEKLDLLVLSKVEHQEEETQGVPGIDYEKISYVELTGFLSELKESVTEEVYGKFARKAFLDYLTEIKESMEQ